MAKSQLLDMRDCSRERFKEIYKEILEISLLQQPKYFLPLLLRSHYIQGLIGYDHWSRAWEYPWAILAANLAQWSLRILDVGGGGSPFPVHLANLGHQSYVIDPSLRGGINLGLDKNKSLVRNIRSCLFQSILKILRINRVEGFPSFAKERCVFYYPCRAQQICFSDNYFDRVFCLSVMEHIPQEDWRKCIQEFERVLKPGGRLIITLDMGTGQANERLYLNLVDLCSLKLIGRPDYEVPINQKDRERRHGHFYETIGLVWE